MSSGGICQLYFYSTYLNGGKLNGKWFDMSLDSYFSKALDNMPRNMKNVLKKTPANVENEEELGASPKIHNKRGC